MSEIVKQWHGEGCTLRLYADNSITDQSDIISDEEMVGYFWQYTPQQFLNFGFGTELHERYGDGFLEAISLLKERLDQHKKC